MPKAPQSRSVAQAVRQRANPYNDIGSPVTLPVISSIYSESQPHFIHVSSPATPNRVADSCETDGDMDAMLQATPRASSVAACHGTCGHFSVPAARPSTPDSFLEDDIEMDDEADTSSNNSEGESDSDSETTDLDEDRSNRNSKNGAELMEYEEDDSEDDEEGDSEDDFEDDVVFFEGSGVPHSDRIAYTHVWPTPEECPWAITYVYEELIFHGIPFAMMKWGRLQLAAKELPSMTFDLLLASAECADYLGEDPGAEYLRFIEAVLATPTICLPRASHFGNRNVFDVFSKVVRAVLVHLGKFTVDENAQTVTRVPSDYLDESGNASVN